MCLVPEMKYQVKYVPISCMSHLLLLHCTNTNVY